MSRRDIAKMLARNAVLGARAETQADYLRAQAERDRAKEVGRALGQLGQTGVQAAQVAANAGLGAYDRYQANQDKKKAEALQKLKLMANQELANQNQFEIDQDAQSITDGDPLLSPLSRSQLASDMQKNLLGAKTKDGFSMVAEPKVKTMPKPIPEEEYQELAGISDARQILGDDLVDAYLFNAGQGPKLSALDKAKLAKSIAETGKLQAETQEILRGKKSQSKWAKEFLPKLSKSAVIKKGDLFKFNPDKSKMASPEDIAKAKKEMVDELVATAPEEIRSKIRPLVEAQITSDVDSYMAKSDSRKPMAVKDYQKFTEQAIAAKSVHSLQKYKRENAEIINKDLSKIRLVQMAITDELGEGFLTKDIGVIMAAIRRASDKAGLDPITREYLRRGAKVNFDLIRGSQSGALSDSDITMGKDMFLQLDDPETFDMSANEVKKNIWDSRQAQLKAVRPEYRVEHMYQSPPWGNKEDISSAPEVVEVKVGKIIGSALYDSAAVAAGSVGAFVGPVAEKLHYVIRDLLADGDLDEDPVALSNVPEQSVNDVENRKLARGKIETDLTIDKRALIELEKAYDRAQTKQLKDTIKTEIEKLKIRVKRLKDLQDDLADSDFSDDNNLPEIKNPRLFIQRAYKKYNLDYFGQKPSKKKKEEKTTEAEKEKKPDSTDENVMDKTRMVEQIEQQLNPSTATEKDNTKSVPLENKGTRGVVPPNEEINDTLKGASDTSSYMTYRASLANSNIDSAISQAANKVKTSKKNIRMQVSQMLDTQGVSPDDPNFEKKALEAIGKLTASSF